MDQPKLRISPDLLRLITSATELKAWIAQAVVDVPWLASLQRDTATRLAHSSTAKDLLHLHLPMFPLVQPAAEPAARTVLAK